MSAGRRLIGRGARLLSRWRWRWLRRPTEKKLEANEDLLRRVRRLEFRTRSFVDSLFGGEYHSVFIGRGLEFSHVRRYESGDDVRAIDWRVTARRGTPFVRRFIEERDLLVTLLVDISPSGRFSPGKRSVAEVATEIVAALAFAATRNSDRLSLLLATDQVERVVPPGSGRRHAVRLLSEYLSHGAAGKGTDLVPALDLVGRRQGGRALVFIVSDFILPAPLDSFEGALGRMARIHDVVAVRIAAPEANRLPGLGWVEMTDPESGKRTLVNTGRRNVRNRYRASVMGSRDAVGEILERAGAEVVDVEVGEDPLAVLARFLKERRATPR